MAKAIPERNNQPEMVLLKNRASIFNALEVSIGEIARKADVDPATVRRLRNGEAVRRTSANKVLRVLREITKTDFSEDLTSA